MLILLLYRYVITAVIIFIIMLLQLLLLLLLCYCFSVTVIITIMLLLLLLLQLCYFYCYYYNCYCYWYCCYCYNSYVIVTDVVTVMFLLHFLFDLQLRHFNTWARSCRYRSTVNTSSITKSCSNLLVRNLQSLFCIL